MTRLSNRQHPMLAHFARRHNTYRMSIEEAQKFDQRPFRSMLMRGWVAYIRAQGFALTEAGRAAWDEFQHTEIARKNPQMPLTAYFDPTAYGLKAPEKARESAVRGAA